ncbi:MAG: S1C family serine protease [Pirellulaceae bacterium]
MLQYGKAIRVIAAALLFSAILSPCVGCGQVAVADEPATATALDTIFAGSAPRDTNELRAMQTLLQSLSERVIPTTVAVQVGQAQGSGVIVSSDGYVLTAAHVVGRERRPAIIVLHDGRRVRGQTLGLFRTMDAGLLKIETSPRDLDRKAWPFAPMGESKKLKSGQWCLATGHPGGFQSARTPVVRVGRILSIDPEAAITTDCTLVGGDSGGPLFDMEGKVIGIHSRIGGPLTLNLHVPIDTYRDSWDRLAAAEVWGAVPGNEPFIGVVGEMDTDVAKITQVHRGTPAEKAGVRVGDVITKIGNQKVTTFETLKDFVTSQEPGTHVDLVVRRGNEILELELTIGKRRDYQ